jgi:hypothetical protein
MCVYLLVVLGYSTTVFNCTGWLQTIELDMEGTSHGLFETQSEHFSGWTQENK